MGTFCTRCASLIKIICRRYKLSWWAYSAPKKNIVYIKKGKWYYTLSSISGRCVEIFVLSLRPKTLNALEFLQEPNVRRIYNKVTFCRTVIFIRTCDCWSFWWQCCSTGIYFFSTGTAVRPCLKVNPAAAQWGEADFSNCMSNEIKEIHDEVRGESNLQLLCSLALWLKVWLKTI